MPTKTALIVLMLTVAGCDPYAGIRVRAQLQPRPTFGCLDTALTASRNITQILSKDSKHAPSFGVVLRDSLMHQGLVPANISIKTSKDSVSTLLVSVFWQGTATRYSDTVKRRWVQLETALIDELATACVPASPRSVECEEHGLGKTRLGACAPIT